MKYMFAKHPQIAKRWESEYHQTGKGLPQKVHKSSAKSAAKKLGY